MSQKAPKEQMPALIGELVNRETNTKMMQLVTEFLEASEVPGSQARDLGKCLMWLDGMVKGEHARMAEIRALLPDQDTEIKLGEAEQADPEPPMAPAVAGESATRVGGVELSKGSEVLQPA